MENSRAFFRCPDNAKTLGLGQVSILACGCKTGYIDTSELQGATLGGLLICCRFLRRCLKVICKSTEKNSVQQRSADSLHGCVKCEKRKVGGDELPLTPREKRMPFIMYCFHIISTWD